MNLQIIEKRGPKINKWDTPTPAIGLCSCGNHVSLDGNTNECKCGKAYNIVGNQVKSNADRQREKFLDSLG